MRICELKNSAFIPLPWDVLFCVLLIIAWFSKSAGLLSSELVHLHGFIECAGQRHRMIFDFLSDFLRFVWLSLGIVPVVIGVTLVCCLVASCSSVEGVCHLLSIVFGRTFWLIRGSEVKASACNAGDQGSIPGSGRFPWRRKWQPTPVFLPGESHGRRNPVGYSPRGCKESDTTERFHFHFGWFTVLDMVNLAALKTGVFKNRSFQNIFYFFLSASKPRRGITVVVWFPDVQFLKDGPCCFPSFLQRLTSPPGL